MNLKSQRANTYPLTREEFVVKSGLHSTIVIFTGMTFDSYIVVISLQSCYTATERMHAVFTYNWESW